MEGDGGLRRATETMLSCALRLCTFGSPASVFVPNPSYLWDTQLI